jgi:hypothetical protein
MNCLICADDKIIKRKCKTCSQGVCVKCSNSIAIKNKNKCPFCKSDDFCHLTAKRKRDKIEYELKEEEELRNLIAINDHTFAIELQREELLEYQNLLPPLNVNYDETVDDEYMGLNDNYDDNYDNDNKLDEQNEQEREQNEQEREQNEQERE